MREPVSVVLDKLNNWLTVDRGLSRVMASTIMFLLFMFLSTFLHESAHLATTTILQCQNGGINHVGLFTGNMGLDCSNLPDENMAMILIAMSAPIFMALLGFYMWFVGGKNNESTRLFGIINLFYGSLPNLAYWNAGTDAAVAVSYGLGSGWAMLIFLGITSISGYLISKEIAEKEPF